MVVNIYDRHLLYTGAFDHRVDGRGAQLQPLLSGELLAQQRVHRLGRHARLLRLAVAVLRGLGAERDGNSMALGRFYREFHRFFMFFSILFMDFHPIMRIFAGFGSISSSSWMRTMPSVT